ncbi:MAG: single-stranded DNA-binding protein [Scytonematopsis contorta HA4267-MV1]|nr:single-stranded DNA-binding protein [Scytonematopsis contorta HA4267-MV1]
MNNCILMAEIYDEPTQRYTPDGMELAEMMVQFPSAREEEPPFMLKVVGWGRIAGEIKQNYHKGDKVILEGRLGMNTIQRREGFKEKQAELNLQRIYPLVTSYDFSAAPSMGTPAAATAYQGNSGVSSYDNNFSNNSNNNYEQQRNTGYSANNNEYGVAPKENYQQPAPQTSNYAPTSYSGSEETNYEPSRPANKPVANNTNTRSQEKFSQPAPPPANSQSDASDDYEDDEIPF